MFTNPTYDTKKMQEVFIPPVPVNTYKSLNYEPQYITQKSISSGILELDSNDCKLETNKVDMLLSTKKTPGDSASTLFTNISRINVIGITVYYVTPNVNPRNNTIRFFSSVTNQFHTVIMDEYNFTDAGDFIDELRDRMNTISGITGLVFTNAIDTTMNVDAVYELNSAGGDYYFDANSSMAIKGKYLSNLPLDQVPTNSKLVGPITLLYSRYMDFASNVLTKYARVLNTSTGYLQNTLVRVDLEQGDSLSIPQHVNTENEIFTAFVYNPGDSVNIIDMKIYDEFGEPFYIPPSPYGDIFYWDMSLRLEA